VSTHAVRSPSGAAGWLECAGWQSDSTGSKFADEGTDAHELAAIALTDGVGHVDIYKGRVMGLGHEVGHEMALAVQDYVDYVNGVAQATAGEVLVEQRLPIEIITGEPDAHGTADAVILSGAELTVVDLKYGRGVPVPAEDNPQLQIYALAALDEFSLVQDFDTVRMVIHQPRIGAVSEWVQSVDELRAFGQLVKKRIEIHDANPEMRNPGEKQCRWCARKATCDALADQVQDAVSASFEDLTSFDPAMTAAWAGKRSGMDGEALGLALRAADLVELWLKAVRAEAEARLLAGERVPGFKLVQGKKGNRKWADDKAAEELLKAMRVKHDQMYDYSVISPTSAEKLAKAEVIGPRQWPRVLALITQSEGRPSVAPESDKRPALVTSAVAADFDDVTTTS
jgi:hypothetical protein